MTMQAAFDLAIQYATNEKRCKLFKGVDGWHVVLN